jgi:hypothetical protein
VVPFFWEPHQAELAVMSDLISLLARSGAHHARATQTDARNPEGGGAARERAPGDTHTGTDRPQTGPARPANRRIDNGGLGRRYPGEQVRANPA